MILGFQKGSKQEDGSNINANASMDESAYVEGQNSKRRYKKGLGVTNIGEKMKEEWTCVQTEYQRTYKEDRKVELEGLKKRAKKTEDDLEEKNEKGYKESRLTYWNGIKQE